MEPKLLQASMAAIITRVNKDKKVDVQALQRQFQSLHNEQVLSLHNYNLEMAAHLSNVEMPNLLLDVQGWTGP